MDEENEDYDEWTEERVSAWHMVYWDLLSTDNVIYITDPNRITQNDIKTVLASFKEKAPGSIGITKNYLLRAPLSNLTAIRRNF